MSTAEVGDDVYRADPTVNRLEQKAAELFGMEAALFCVSGTMTNQIAIAVHTRPGDEVICHQLAHIYVYEGGGIMTNAGASVRLIGDPNGLMRPEQVSAAINPNDIHLARSRLVAVENTSNKGGGTCYELSQLQAIGEIAAQGGLSYHLDGARLFNALVATGETPESYGNLFNSISICLSKGLGCPVGSLLLGDREFIREARRVRKRFGGGWRQAGFLAAAGIYALDNHVDRLSDDHAKASTLGACLEHLPYVASVQPVQTNIVVFRLREEDRSGEFAASLANAGIRITHLGGGVLRMVAHLDISSTDLEKVCNVLTELEF